MATESAAPVDVRKRWTPSLIRRLRGTRTQTEFGRLLRVPKNTVWRWESGRAAPARRHAQFLAELAAREHFLEDWELVGSIELLGSLEKGSATVAESLGKSLERSSREPG